MTDKEAMKLALEALGAYMAATDDDEDAKAYWLMDEAFFALKERLAQPEQERNFCSRCGKRTKDLTHIHTCTPPKENT
jgi:hypothetical protein